MERHTVSRTVACLHSTHTFSHSSHHPSNVSWKTGFEGTESAFACLMGLCSVRLKRQGVCRAGTGCGVHCSYSGTAEDSEAWERPEGAPLLPCSTGDSAPGQARYSFPILPHSTLAQGRWPGVFRLSLGIRLQAPGNRPTPHCHLQMAKGRPRGGKGTSSPTAPRPSSSPQQTGLLVSFTGGGSDFSKTV